MYDNHKEAYEDGAGWIQIFYPVLDPEELNSVTAPILSLSVSLSATYWCPHPSSCSLFPIPLGYFNKCLALQICKCMYTLYTFIHTYIHSYRSYKSYHTVFGLEGRGSQHEIWGIVMLGFTRGSHSENGVSPAQPGEFKQVGRTLEAWRTLIGSHLCLPEILHLLFGVNNATNRVIWDISSQGHTMWTVPLYSCISHKPPCKQKPFVPGSSGVAQ